MPTCQDNSSWRDTLFIHIEEPDTEIMFYSIFKDTLFTKFSNISSLTSFEKPAFHDRIAPILHSRSDFEEASPSQNDGSRGNSCKR